MKPIFLAMLGALTGAVMLTTTQPTPAEPLKVASLPNILESAPLLVAVENSLPENAVGMNGSTPNLWLVETFRDFLVWPMWRAMRKRSSCAPRSNTRTCALS